MDDTTHFWIEAPPTFGVKSLHSSAGTDTGNVVIAHISLLKLRVNISLIVAKTHRYLYDPLYIGVLQTGHPQDGEPEKSQKGKNNE